MKRALKLIAYGLAGIIVTAGFTAAAFAVAGKDIAQPASPVGSFRTPAEPTPSGSHTAGGTNSVGKEHETTTTSPTPDDKGSTTTGSGSGDTTPITVGPSPSSSPTADSGSGDSSSGDSGGDSHTDD